MAKAPVTRGVRRAPRKGTSSAHASKRARPAHAPAWNRGHVLRSVLRHVHVYVTQSSGGSHGSSGESGAPATTSRPGKPRKRRNRHRGCRRVDARTTRRAEAPSKEGVTRQKRKGALASVPARTRGLGFASVRRKNVAEVGRRRLASNKLSCSAPKRVAAGVNGGLAGIIVDYAFARTSARTSSERMTARRPRTAQTVQDRRRPRLTRERHPAVAPSRKRCGGRGTGAVKATGSFEGFLPAEDTSGHSETSLFTEGRGS